MAIGEIMRWPIGGLDRSQFRALSENIAGERFYEHGWLYATQAMRHGGWIFSGDRFLAAVSENDGYTESPSVVWTLGSLSVGQYIDLCLRAQELSGSGIVRVRHLTQQIAKYLMQADARFGLFFDDEAPIEKQPEERFPQVIITLCDFTAGINRLRLGEIELAVYGGLRGENFRESVQRGLRAAIGEGALLDCRWFNYPRKAILACARKNAQWHVGRLERRGIAVEQGWKGLFEPVEPVIKTADEQVEGMVLVSKRGVEAFALWDHIAQDTAGLYAMGSSPALACAMDLTLSAVYNSAMKKGVRELSLGGSEYEGLDFFKRKPGAYQSRKVTQLEFRNDRQGKCSSGGSAAEEVPGVSKRA